MDQSCRALGFFFVDNNGNLYLRSRNHLNIDSGPSQACKQSGRDAGMGSHSDANDAQFGHAARGIGMALEGGVPEIVRVVLPADGKGDVGSLRRARTK